MCHPEENQREAPFEAYVLHVPKLLFELHTQYCEQIFEFFRREPQRLRELKGSDAHEELVRIDASGTWEVRHLKPLPPWAQRLGQSLQQPLPRILSFAQRRELCVVEDVPGPRGGENCPDELIVRICGKQDQLLCLQ